MLSRPRRCIVAVVGLATLAAACASDGDDSRGADTPTATTVLPKQRAPDAGPKTTDSGAVDDAQDPAAPDAPGPDPSAGPSDDVEDPAIGGEVGGPGAGDDELYPELGSAALDVQHYDLAVAYDIDAGTLDAHVRIETALTSSVDELVLDATEIDIAVVAVNGQEAEFTLTQDDVRIALDEPLGPVGPDGAITIDIAYQDRATTIDSETGLPVGWFATADGSFVLNEPDGASTWLPSNDHPADKATWRFEITVPAGSTAVANGELVEQIEGKNATTWVWEQRDPMSTYLMLLLTGDYQVLDGGVYAGAAGPVPLTNVALTADVERMQPYFDLTIDQLTFFEGLFGPYPLDRYGLAFSDSVGGLAMETQGRSLFSRDDFPGGEPDHGAHLLTSHELAHQWFGNAVSPADWSDLWLNESFATYGQWLWLDHIGLDTLEQRSQDALAHRQVASEPTGTPTVGNLFGFERYDGGAVVVHALRGEVGDEAFFELLRRWVADNDGASRTTEDFVALAEAVTGRDLSGFFERWLFAPAVPASYPG